MMSVEEDLSQFWQEAEKESLKRETEATFRVDIIRKARVRNAKAMALTPEEIPRKEFIMGREEDENDIVITRPTTIKQQEGAEYDGHGYLFSQPWLAMIRAEWVQRTSHLRHQKLRILELGSFEGASTTWILDNLMNHDESNLIAVDTFEGGMEHQKGPDGQDSYNLSSWPLLHRFKSNVSQSHNYDKLTFMKSTTLAALLTLRRQNRMFDFIYIDASHVAIDVLSDAIMCWHMLPVGGMMVFDDFSWKGYLEDCYNPRIAIEGFLACVKPEVESEETESQMWVKRVLKRGFPTPNLDPDLYYWDRGLAKKELSDEIGDEATGSNAGKKGSAELRVSEAESGTGA